MKKKNMYFIVIIIIVVVAILGIIGMILSFSKKENNVPIEEEPKEELIIIKSTKDNPIEKDQLEVTSIEIKRIINDLEITAIIKNHSDKDINGYFIEIQLLDNDQNVVTSISENSKNVIKAQEEYTFNSSVAGLEKVSKIVNAKVGILEKNKNDVEY